MKRLSLTLILPLALALPGMAMAQSSADESLGADMQRLVSSFRDAGCTVPMGALRMFLQESGLTDRDHADVVMNTAALDGLVVADFSGEPPTFALAPALCDPLGAGDMRATLTLALRMNGCAMSEAAGDALFGGMGLTGNDTGETAVAMVGAGELAVSEDGSATLSTALCEGTDETLASPRGAFYAQMRSANCILDRDGAAELMEHPLFADLPGDALEQMLYTLQETGKVGDGDELRLHPDICAAV